MNMREALYDVLKTFNTDEDLLRLLYYKPDDEDDSPLDPAKPNILTMEATARWEIIKDVIKPSKTVADLDKTEKCRVLFYAGRRTGNQHGNYAIANQTVIIDILTHVSFDEVDMRNAWIVDQVNSLLHDQEVTGGVKMLFRSGDQITTPINYVGYRLTYEFIALQ